MPDTLTAPASPARTPLDREPPARTLRTEVSASLTMTGRAIRLSRRNIDALITSAMLPIMMMLIFVYFFGGAINTGTQYVTYVVPGVLLLCAGFGSSTTAISVTEDMKGGIIDRFRSLDIGATPILAGQVLASTARNALATVLVLGVAYAIGFRPSATLPGWLAAAGVLLAFILALSWMSAAIGLLTKSPEAAGGFTFFVSFLPYPSSAFVPVETMPTWLHGFADNQPVTPVIESLRALLLDRPLGDTGWVALSWCVGILVVSMVAAEVLFRRRTA